MALSGSFASNTITIGGQPNNYYFVNWSATQNKAANQSTISWAAYFHFTLADSQLDGAYIDGVWGPTGRNVNFSNNFTTRNVLLGSSSFTVTHDVEGKYTLNLSGGITVYSGNKISGSGSWTLDQIDRTPTTPTLTNALRAVSGASFSSTATGGVNNSGPAVTWTLQRADDSGFTTNVVDGTSTTTSGSTVSSSSLTTTQTYYFRIKATNDAGTKYSSVATSYGVPGPPTGLTVTPSTTDAGKIALSWTAPTNTQGGITGYNLFVNDVYADTTTGTSFTSVRANTSNGALVPGTNYVYKVAAKNATNGSSTTLSDFASSTVTGSSVKAPGPPTAPTYGSNPNPPSKTGRNVTIAVTANADGINASTPVTAYYVQYRTSTTSGGTYGTWSTPQAMSLSGGNYTYTYNLLAPALWYKFRVYAKNSIINTVSPSTGAVTRSYYPDDNSSYTANFSAETTPLFVSSGGKRWNGSAWVPTEIAKRWNGSQWVDITIAKRWDGSQWVDLT